MNNRDWMDGFISGLITGEGSFIVSIQKSKNSRLGYSVRLSMSIEMHHREKDMLFAVKDFLGIGEVRDIPERKNRTNSSKTVRYEVCKIQECLILAEYFKNNPLLGGKKQSFDQWLKCLILIAKGEHHTFEGFKQVVELRQIVNEYCRTSNFIERDFVLLDAAKVNDKMRSLSTWSKKEELILIDYLNKKITRAELIQTLHPRPIPSIDNKLCRLRKMQSAGDASSETIKKYIANQKTR